MNRQVIGKLCLGMLALVLVDAESSTVGRLHSFVGLLEGPLFALPQNILYYGLITSSWHGLGILGPGFPFCRTELYLCSSVPVDHRTHRLPSVQSPYFSVGFRSCSTQLCVSPMPQSPVQAPCSVP